MDWAVGAPKLNGGAKPTGPAAGLLVGSWLSAALALNAGWLAAPEYGGSGFTLVLKVLPKAEVEEPNVSAGWPAVAGAEDVNVVLPNMLKPAVVVGAVEFAGAWPNAGPPVTLAVAETVAGAGFPNWNTGAAKVGAVLVAELDRPPNTKGCDTLVDAVVVTVRLVLVEAGGLSPKLNTGLMVASVEELSVVAVVAAVVKMTFGRAVNPASVVVEAAGTSAAEAGCDSGLKAKGETFAGDEAVVTLPKMGLNMVVVEGAEEGAELTDAVTTAEMTVVPGAVLSLFGKAPKMGLKTGVVVGTAAAAVTAGWLAGGALGAPKRMFGFSTEGGSLGVGPSSVVAGGATLLAGCVPEAGEMERAAVLSTGTGLVSAEVAG